jgi:adenosine deaminase
MNDISSKIKAMPKIDLHCHLDGSLSTEFVSNAVSCGCSQDELLSLMQAPADCASLTDYLTCFDTPIKALQTADNITSAVLDVLSQAALENVTYIELRFAPSFSVHDGLSYSDVCEAAIRGCKLGLERFGIYSNIILCAMRHLDLDTNLKTLECVRTYLGNGICALDLAGDESMFPNEGFTELFKRARQLDVPFTIHSGECGSVENVRLAMEFGARRVGHGIALAKDAALMAECQKLGTGLELCPTSNFQTHAVEDRQNYPLKRFLSSNLLATVNTDNRTVSGTNMTNELLLAYNNLGIDYDDLHQIYKNSVEISFADDKTKNILLSKWQ